MSPKGVCQFSCSKANKQARLVERKVCLISDAGNWGWGGGGHLSKGPLLPPHPLLTGVRGAGRGPRAEAARASLTVIPRVVVSRLTSIILGISGTVNLQSQVHWFHFFVVNSRNWGSSWPGYGLVIIS